MEFLDSEDIEVDPTFVDLRFVTRAIGLSIGLTDDRTALAIVLRDENRAPIAYTLATPETVRVLLNRCLEIQ